MGEQKGGDCLGDALFEIEQDLMDLEESMLLAPYIGSEWNQKVLAIVEKVKNLQKG